MRHVLFLLGLVLFLIVGTASAQSSSTNSMLLAAPFSLSSTGAVSIAPTPAISTAYTLSSSDSAPDSGAVSAKNPFSTASTPAPAPDPQYVQGVFVNYEWQAYIGYTFLHFGDGHGISRNMNGLNWGI